MMGRPASACGSVAAAREASLRLRHQGPRLRREEVSPSPRSARRRRAPSPSSTSVSDLREALLRRLRLRRAAHPSPPHPSPLQGIGLLSPACAAPECLHRVDFLGAMGRPPSPQRAALSPACASTAQEALRYRAATSPAVPCPPPPPPRGTGPLSSCYAALQDLHRVQILGVLGRSPSPPSPRRVALFPASASTSTAGQEALCCRRHLGVDKLSSAYATSADLHGVHFVGMMAPAARPPRVALSPASSASAPLHDELLSACISTAREAPGRTLMAPATVLGEAFSFTALLTHKTSSMAMLPASLAVHPPNKPGQEEMTGPVLIITNLELPRSILFSPYTMKTLTSSLQFDMADVLYSNGYFFLLKEGTYVSVWEVKSEKRLRNFHIGVEIEQGYFKGSPASEMTVVLARQRVFGEQVDADGGEANQVDPDIVTEFWLRTPDGAWQQNAVVCAHAGIHSLIIHDNAVFWLSDDGCLCSVRQEEAGLQLMEWDGAVETIGTSFALLEHLDSLYIVKSGGILENLAGIYQVIPCDPPAFPETRMVGQNVFIVHGRSGMILANQSDDSRVFTAPLIEDSDCSRFSYVQNRHDNIRPCQAEVFHMWCTAAWAVMEPSL